MCLCLSVVPSIGALCFQSFFVCVGFVINWSLLSSNKKGLFCLHGVRPQLEFCVLLERFGWDQIPTFGKMQVWGLEMASWDDFRMILNGFASRKVKIRLNI